MKSVRAPLLVRRAATAAGLALLAALPARAQTASLVADLNPGAWESAAPQAQNLFAAGGKLFFATGYQGEPAVVDAANGSAGSGTTLLADLCPECGSSPEYLGSLGNVVLFVATPGGSGTASGLYRTDGTRAGTFSLGVAADRPGFGSPSFRQVFAGGLFFFIHCDQGGRCELWKTDGTVAGTGRVKDLAPGSSINPRIDTLTAVGRRVFFFVDLVTTIELWASDGTAAGTTRVRAFPDRPFLSTRAGGSSRFYFLSRTTFEQPEQIWVSDGTAAGTRSVSQFQNSGALAESTLQVLGDQAYVVANDVLHGDELWTSDGTPAGTRRLTEFGYFTPFASRSAPVPLVGLGSRQVFPATDGLHGVQIWTTTGTPESTTALGPAQFRGQRLVPVAGGRAVFLAEGDAGAELWGTDGTPPGTRRLPLACAGHCTLSGADPTPLFGLAFFTVQDGNGVVSLWSSDGTPAGSRRFAGPFPGNFSTAVGELAAVSRQVFFTLQTDGTSTYRLWTSDGQPGGTRPVPGLDSGGSSNPFDLVPLASQLAFTACDGQDRQVFRTAGTPATTERTDLHTFFPECNAGGGPEELTAAGSTVFFWFENDSSDEELWSLPPSGGAVRLAGFGFLGGSVPRLVALGDRVYFILRPLDDNELQLWQSDGTPAGTVRATGLAAIPSPNRIDRVGGTLYIQGFSDAGRELWTSDGTAAGTRQLRVDHDQFLGPFAQAGPWVFFFVVTSDYHTDLWRTDGTAAGTSLVREVSSATFDSPADPVALSGTLYFFASTPTGRALFRSDGTAAGTVALKEFRPESDSFSSQPVSSYLTVFAGRLFFAANDGVSGRELWSSDGTAAGTVRVADVNPGPGSGRVAELAVAGGRLYFAAYDPVHGSELWESDGTAGGTRLAADLAPESASSYPKHLAAVGSRLYFAANDGISGYELWTIDTAAPAACQSGDTRLCLASGRFQVEVDWKDFQGNTGTGHAVPLTADTGYFWFFADSNVEAVVKVLDARSLNQAFWIFYGALSSVDYTITVTDTQTGLSRRYHNPSGQLASVGDTNGFGPLGAFDTKTFETSAPALALVAARTDARAATGTCTSGPGKLCLQSNRFALTTAWKDFQGHTGTGTAVSLTGDTGYFWFFSPTNVEVVTKVLDGRGLNNKFWLFYGALSNVEYTLTVTDTQTGAVKTYKNPLGQFGSVGDTGAF